MESRTYYYARVSSTGQNLARQLDMFKKMGAEDRDIIVDKESGKNLQRSGYQALRTTLLRKGDTLVICSLDRLSRNKSDIRSEIQYFKENDIRLKILDIPTSLIDQPEGSEWVLDMIQNILLEVLGSFAEHERLEIKARQEAGIKSAKARGQKFGRPAVKCPDNFAEVYEKWKNKEITATEAMRITGLKRNKFYDFAREREALYV